jgi:hypothetical protein
MRLTCANAGDSRAILARQSNHYKTKPIKKVGKLYISLKIINHLLKKKEKELSKKEERFIVLKIKMETELVHKECGYQIKVIIKKCRFARFGNEPFTW